MRNFWKDQPFGWSFLFRLFWLKPGSDTGFQKGIPRSSTRFIRAQRGSKDSDLRAGARLKALP